MNNVELLPVFIRAGAGTGKTHYLMERVIYLINKHHSACTDKICRADAVLPKIALITFTENAASMMKGRLISLIDFKLFSKKEISKPCCFIAEKEALFNSSITTIHSFCRKEIMPHLCENGWDIETDILENETGFLKKSFITFLNEKINLTDNIPTVLSKNLKYLIEAAVEIYKQSRALGAPEKEFIDNLIMDSKGKTEIAKLLSLIYGFYDFVNEEKKRLSIWSYDDMLRFMYDALMSNDFNDSLRKKYDYILIDEFQDTDPIQLKIAMILSSRQKGFNPKIKELEIDPKRLLIAGDKRQSIYGFRNASPRLMNIFYKLLAEQGLPEKTLSVNFRSAPSVLNTVNSIFSKIWKEDYIPLSPDIQSSDTKLTSSLYKIIPEKENIDAVRYLEAEGIKSVCRILASSGISYGDIVILAQDKLAIAAVEKSLKSCEIPFFVFKISGFTHNPLVWDLLSIMMASLNRASLHADTINRLPFIIENRDSFFDDLSDVQINKGLSSGLRFLIKKLDLQNLLPGNEWNCHSLWINIEKLSSLINIKEKQGISSIQILNYLMELPEDSESGREVQPAGDFANMVRVMTIHSAKGLEFPYVLVAGLKRGRNRGYAKILSELNEEGILLGLKFEEEESEGYKKLKTLKNEDKLNEYFNLIYVAFTRAKKAFFAFPAATKKNDQFMDILLGLSQGSPLSALPEKKETLPAVIPVSKQIDLNKYLLSHISVSKITDILAEKGAALTDKSSINIGTFIHRLIEISPIWHDGLKKQVNRLAEIFGLSEIPYNIIENIYDIIGKLIKSYKPNRIMREYPIYAKFPGKNIIIHGICDLVLECNDMTIIADIKTGNPDEPHKLQVGLYGWILNKSRKNNIKGLILYPSLNKGSIIICNPLNDEDAFSYINDTRISQFIL